MDDLVTLIDVLDRELITLQLVLTLHVIGPGARNADADEDGITLHPSRPSADRRLVLSKNRTWQTGQRGAAGQAGAEPQNVAPRQWKVRCIGPDRHGCVSIPGFGGLVAVPRLRPYGPTGQSRKRHALE